MGVKGLREAFNKVAAPAYTCTLALLDYDFKHDAESQILTFSGMAASGEKFEVSSRDIRPNEDVYAIAAETAQQLIDKGKTQ